MASQELHPSSSDSEHKPDGPLSQSGRYAEKEPSQQPRDSITTDFGPPPDGGLEAWTRPSIHFKHIQCDTWLVVAGGFGANFASFGWINCIGTLQDYYQQHQLKSYSPSTVAWISSVEASMLFFWGPIVGKMTDELGPRIPILLDSFLYIFGLTMASISKQYYQILLSHSICSALGCSFLFYSSIGAVGTWFFRHRAIAFGIANAGSSLGGVVLPIMVNHLVIHIGFGWTMRSTAFLFLGLLTIADLTIKSRLPPPHEGFNPKDFVRPFREFPFLLLTVAAFMIYLGSFLPFTFIIVQADALGVSRNLAEYLVSITNASSTFGRIPPAYLGDSIGVFNVMIPMTLLGGIFTLALWLPARSSTLLKVYAVLYGLTSGCTLSIIPAIVASISDVRSISIRNGSLYGVAAVGALIGSPIAGAIVNEQGGKFSGLIPFCGVSILLGSGFAIASRYTLVSLEWRKKV